MVEELWKPVVGMEKDYLVSSRGRVKALGKEWKTGRYGHRRKSDERIMNLSKRSGYPQVAVSTSGKKNSYMVHRLVAEAFIPNDENKPYVNHIDGNKANNNVENLEWVTPLENSRHAANEGFYSSGSKHYFSKLTEDIVWEIRERAQSEKLSYAELGRQYGVLDTTISKIVRGLSWKHVPFPKEGSE